MLRERLLGARVLRRKGIAVLGELGRVPLGPQGLRKSLESVRELVDSTNQRSVPFTHAAAHHNCRLWCSVGEVRWVGEH